MTSASMASDAAITIKEQARLLSHLAQPGHFAAISALDCGRIALFRTAGSTSLGAGHVAMDAAEALIAAGQLRWSGEGRAQRLELATPTRSGSDLSVRTIVVEGRTQTVLVDERESPLLWLYRRRGKDGRPQISDEQFAAGERFRADLTLAQMLPRTTMNWQAAAAPDDRGPGVRGPAAATDAALAAKQRVRNACDRLGGELSGLAIDVCGFLKGLDSVERERGWPARSAKLMLKLALSNLAEHYGIVAPGKPPSRPRRSVWRDRDARPVIQPPQR